MQPISIGHLGYVSKENVHTTEHYP